MLFAVFLLLLRAMKVLIVNTSELTGGAAVAANRLTEGLNTAGVKAKMMVCHKQTNDVTVAPCGTAVQNKLDFLWERLGIFAANRLSTANLWKVSTASAGVDITRTQEFEEADIVHLHWVNQGMLSLKGIGRVLDSGKPVVWTMHDMWPMTAICHHAYECEHYADECHSCPLLKHPSRNDLAARVFRKKRQMLEGRTNLTFVAVSEWLARRARKSALTGGFPIRVIANALPPEDFTLTDRIDARTAVEAGEPYVVAFGAARIDDPIKGLQYLTGALRLLTEQGRFRREDVRLLLFGNVKNPKVLDDIPVPYTHLGYIDDSYRMSQVYSASNITVSASLYETFGQTLTEAMACGSVPVAFGGSGQADIITHLKTGYLAERLSVQSLAEGIEWGLRTSEHGGRELRRELRRSAIRRYATGVVARQYVELYNEVRGKRQEV